MGWVVKAGATARLRGNLVTGGHFPGLFLRSCLVYYTLWSRPKGLVSLKLGMFLSSPRLCEWWYLVSTLAVEAYLTS